MTASDQEGRGDGTGASFLAAEGAGDGKGWFIPRSVRRDLSTRIAPVAAGRRCSRRCYFRSLALISVTGTLAAF